MIQARPTIYKGIQMRSRLEASFAQWLDEERPYGLTGWDYEPECYASGEGQYLPDFRLRYDSGAVAYVEVKPEPADIPVALKRMHIILASERDARLVVAHSQGGYPDVDWCLESRCEPQFPCCDRVCPKPILAWDIRPPMRMRGGAQAGYSESITLRCAYCGAAGPRIVTAYAAPLVDDGPEGPPSIAHIGMRCDACDRQWALYISTVVPGQTNLGVRHY